MRRVSKKVLCSKRRSGVEQIWRWRAYSTATHEILHSHSCVPIIAATHLQQEEEVGMPAQLRSLGVEASLFGRLQDLDLFALVVASMLHCWQTHRATAMFAMLLRIYFSMHMKVSLLVIVVVGIQMRVCLMEVILLVHCRIVSRVHSKYYSKAQLTLPEHLDRAQNCWPWCLEKGGRSFVNHRKVIAEGNLRSRKSTNSLSSKFLGELRRS